MRAGTRFVGIFAILTVVAAAATLHAQGTDPKLPDDILPQAFRILISAFVIAVLLESAFALVFNWRLFLEFFVGKAWRTPIMFGAALLVVRAFPQLDLIARLFAVYSGSPAARTPSARSSAPAST